MSKVDKQLAHYIADEFKPCIFVVNKWDQLAGQIPTERWVRYLREHFPTMAYCPIAFVTGQTGKNVKALLNHAQMLFKQAKERISTSMLNKLVKAAMERHEPALYQMKRPKIYYATQVSSEPPTIVLVCNNAQGFTGPYRRYLLGFLRDHLPFGEIPIKLYLQPRKRDDDRDDIKMDTQPKRRIAVAEESDEGSIYESENEGVYEDEWDGEELGEEEWEGEPNAHFEEGDIAEDPTESPESSSPKKASPKKSARQKNEAPEPE